jgi:hypothetical protein
VIGESPRATLTAAPNGSRPAHTVSVALFTPSQLIIGAIDPKGQRISDIVNNNTTSYLTLFDAEVQDLLTGGDPKPAVPELTMRKDALDLVVPQDTQPLGRPQVATHRVGLEVTTSFFRVRGGLHRRGSDPTNLVQLMGGYNRQFLPLAEATIEHLMREDVRTTAQIVLVNAQHLHSWAALGGGTWPAQS